MPDTLKLPTYDDVAAAAARIEGHAHRTPVMRSRTADEALGAEVFFKCENLQRMGAFKFRGAFNALSKFDERQRRAGVVAFSSGNHAQAIALAARMLGMPATIVMPHDAPAAKVAATKGYGGQVVIYDRYKDDREQIGRDLAEKHGLTLIPPYDHPDVIAGQGTAAKELFEEVGRARRLLRAAGRRRPALGLGAGDARAVAALQALRRGAGSRQRRAAVVSQRRASSTSTRRRPSPTARRRSTWANYTFPIIRRDVDDVLTASDAQLVECHALLRRAHEAGGGTHRLPGLRGRARR